MRISLRDKRQLTLPAELCKELGLEPGDLLDAEVEDGKLVVRLARKAALDALRELQRAFAEAGISEDEWIEGAREVRKEIFREDYPELAERYGV
ncbi:MAG TPA: AbrB/MazE/SpoVT family DNA-binding domain-containing protein [Dehalococcoidia bacterium]|nr:AbrB/MazE/SpoVT family DNA-binding domain-containing protein [Dehalococcoidia bacterium]